MTLSIGRVEKQRRREFAQDNPDYKEKRTVVYAGISQTEEGGRGIVVGYRLSVVRRIAISSQPSARVGNCLKQDLQDL